MLVARVHVWLPWLTGVTGQTSRNRTVFESQWDACEVYDTYQLSRHDTHRPHATDDGHVLMRKESYTLYSTCSLACDSIQYCSTEYHFYQYARE